MKKLLLFILISLTGTVFSQNFYLGTGDESSVGIGACAACHKTGGSATPVYNQWKQTRHAKAMDSLITTTGFGYNCLKCHNTGWDAATTNYGADEYVTQNSGSTPDYTITDATNFNRVKNVGCESCHGPLGTSARMLSGDHWGFGTTNKKNYSSDLCGTCHQGTHHPYMEEWSSSAHATSAEQAFVTGNKSCVKCHVAQNFIAYANNPTGYVDTILVTGADIQPLTCVTCHDPHGSTNPGSLRFPTGGGTSICDKCHTVGTEQVDINTTPHHTTSEVLSGTANFGFQYPGQTYSNSVHTFAVTERCVTCHVHREPFSGSTAAKTGHTFEPNTGACVTCHADYYSVVDTSNHAKRFDYRGVQTTTDSLLNVLQNKLNAASSADSLTDAFKQAKYNLLSVQAEGSRGIHNTQLVQKLLRDAIANFTPTDIKSETGTPAEFTLSQNFPNPFNPSTEIKFAVPSKAVVKISVYDAIGNLVETLVNREFEPGNHKISFNGRNHTSGIYFYKLETKNISLVKKMILIK